MLISSYQSESEMLMEVKPVPKAKLSELPKGGGMRFYSSTPSPFILHSDSPTKAEKPKPHVEIDPMKCDCMKKLKMYMVLVGEADESECVWLCPSCDFGKRPDPEKKISDLADMLRALDFKPSASSSITLGGTSMIDFDSDSSTLTTSPNDTLTLDAIDTAIAASDSYVLGSRYIMTNKSGDMIGWKEDENI